MQSTAIFVIVYNLASKNLSKVEYWLKQLKACNTGDELVIIVGTHEDECTAEQIEEAKNLIEDRFRKSFYTTLVTNLTISARNGNGIKELKELLNQVSHRLKIPTQVSCEWVNFYFVIQSMIDKGKSYLPWTEYNSWADQCGISSKSDLMAVSKLFQDSGRIIHFYDKSNRIGNDLVILQPQWLANVMACLVTFKSNFSRKGIVDENAIRSAFASYPEAFHKVFIDLLCKFKILHAIDSSNYVIPSLLSSARPTTDIIKWYPGRDPIDCNSIGRVYCFNKLPLGLFGLLMVSLLRITGVESKLFWSNGLVFTMASLDEPSEVESKRPSPTPTRPRVESRTSIPPRTNVQPSDESSMNSAPISGSSNTFKQSRSGSTVQPKLQRVRRIPLKQSSDDMILLDKWKSSRKISEDILKLIPTTTLPHNQKTQNIGLIEYDPDTFQLRFHFRFPKNNRKEAIRLWRVLENTIKGVVEFYPTLRSSLEIFVPCTHCMRKNYWQKVFLFSYAECQLAVQNLKPFVYCQHIESPTRMVRISELAPDLDLFHLPQIDVNKLIVQEVLGEGTYGKVLKGELDGNLVAIKLLKGSAVLEHFSEFQSEAYLMSLLDHPNIVKFYGITVQPPQIILQFINGSDLFQFLHPKITAGGTISNLSQESFPWPRRLNIAYSIAKGLHYLQSITPPIIHRDLRSPNIFVWDLSFHFIIFFLFVVFEIQHSFSKNLPASFKTNFEHNVCLVDR